MESLHERFDLSGAAMPGYRRLIRIVPQDALVVALLEDDIHSMAVRLFHDGERVLRIEAVLDRMPWTTCPGAAAVLVETFTGQLLAEVTLRKERKANCTHLHDLAVLAAAHAHDPQETRYDIQVSDPETGCRELTLQCNGEAQLHWTEQDGLIVAPPQLAGRSLLTLRDAIAGLEVGQAELARLLQWAGLVAHGRTIPLAQQSDATRIAPNCYTFQPERALTARRVGRIVDFSAAEQAPGDVLGRELGLAIT